MAHAACAATLGCWEAYISNIATLSRYLGRDASKIHPRLVLETDSDRLTVTDVIGRARQGDAKALDLYSIHGSLSWFRARERRQWAKSGAGLPRRRDHGGLGSDRGHCSGRPGGARAYRSPGCNAGSRGLIRGESAAARGGCTDRCTNVCGDTCRVSRMLDSVSVRKEVEIVAQPRGGKIQVKSS